MKEIDFSVLLDDWQEIVDVLAKIINVPAGLIMHLDNGILSVLVSSSTKNNPYKVGQGDVMQESGLYCERVINTNRMLKVPNALKSEEWKNNPDIKLNMISYLGFPICLSNGSQFGTICILDNKENSYNPEYEKIIEKFRDFIQSELTIIEQNLELTILAELDSLTKIFNRRIFFEKAEVELSASLRYKRSFSILMIDIDFFKQVNDTFGHQAGDSVLVNFSKLVKSLLRTSDIFGRYGGEEFVIALPETNLEMVKKLANRILKKTEQLETIFNNHIILITVSIGIGVRNTSSTLETILDQADKSLYKAKNSGRNCYF